LSFFIIFSVGTVIYIYIEKHVSLTSVHYRVPNRSELEDGLAAAKHNIACALTEAIRQEYLTRSRALTSGSKHSINFNRMLEERQILLSLQKKELKMREANLTEEQVCDLHSFDEHDLSAELEKLHTLVARAEEMHAIEVGKLAVLVVQASSTLVDLGMLRIWEVP
jgi:hypothetical protein